jgi:hypothetical protein
MTLEGLTWSIHFGFMGCRCIYALTHTLYMMNFENDLLHWIVAIICENCTGDIFTSYKH